MSRGNLGLFAGMLIAAFFLGGFGPPRLVDHFGTPSHRLSLEELRQIEVAQQRPNVTAGAFLIYDAAADQIVLAEDSNVALPFASLTKLMTALLIFEQQILTQTVIIQRSDLVGDASMGLYIGEQLTVEELLWGLLIPSGNDAALALARRGAPAGSGTIEAFVGQMNLRAQELGLAQTHFINPHGLDAPGHVSSAADVLTLVKQLWTYPLFREIVKTPDATVAGHTLHSTNELLTTFPGVVGVKTGTSDAAGQCLVASIERDGRQVFIVVLGSQDRYADVQNLYTFYQANYTWVTGSMETPPALNRLYDDEETVYYLRAVGVEPGRLLRPWETMRLYPFRLLQLPSAGVPWLPGMEVGVIEWWYDDEIIERQSLVLW